MKFITHHKLKLITAAKEIGDCCAESIMTNFFNGLLPADTTSTTKLSIFKWTIINLVSSRKTKLTGSKYDKWREYEAGNDISRNVCMSKYDRHLISCCLDWNLHAISGDFKTKNNPITTAYYYIPTKGSKYEAK